MGKGGLKKNFGRRGPDHKRMYEARHQFASRALAAGESPDWVARTLGYLDASMACDAFIC